MECTRCGGTVTTYRLSGRTAFVCDSCGRVGIEADHHGQAPTRETWDEAIRRFYRREGGERGDAADVERAAAALADTGDVTDVDPSDAESAREGTTDADVTSASTGTDGRSASPGNDPDVDDS